jgi:hypothetical protein
LLIADLFELLVHVFFLKKYCFFAEGKKKTYPGAVWLWFRLALDYQRRFTACCGSGQQFGEESSGFCGFFVEVK